MAGQLNTDLLNAIKDQIIRMCNRDGISLADHFETPENFRQWIISLTIKMVMEVAGLVISEAYDLVMGSGAFQELSDSVWEQLQAE